MSTFTDLCHEHQADTDRDTAAAILAALKVRSAAAVVLLPIVANSVRIILRQETRNAEWSLEDAADDSEPVDYRKLIGESFALLDGRRVLWSNATIADHEARITMLTTMRNGIDHTIRRHLAAIAELKASAA